MKILSQKNQAGFRKNYRTSDHIYILKTIIDKYKASNNKLFTAFMDLRKAFDSVWRNGLYHKLLKLVTGGKFYNLIKNT